MELSGIDYETRIKILTQPPTSPGYVAHSFNFLFLVYAVWLAILAVGILYAVSRRFTSLQCYFEIEKPITKRVAREHVTETGKSLIRTSPISHLLSYLSGTITEEGLGAKFK